MKGGLAPQPGCTIPDTGGYTI